MDVARSLLENAAKFPEKVALAWDHSSLTYESLAEKVGQTAAELRSLGLATGDFVILAMDGSPESVILHYASIFLGLISVPISPSLPPERLGFILRKTRPRLMYLPRALVGSRPSEEAPHGILLTGGAPDMDKSPMSASAFLDQCSRPAVGPDVLLSSIVATLFTTGTTNEPKGVMLSLENISAAANNINEYMGLTESDVEVLSLPMFHSFGLGRLRCVLYAGCRGFILNSRFRPEILLKKIYDEQATVFSQVPLGMSFLMSFGDRVKSYTQTIRLIEIGSSPMPVEDKLRLMDLFPSARICHHYGLTEASRSLFIEYTEAAALGKLGSIGKPSPNVEVRLVDANGTEGTSGAIAIRGLHVNVGYLDEADGLDVRDAGKWLITDDIAETDADGYFYYLGRQSDVINVGGFKVNPLEIERVLNEHQSIMESAVVGHSRSSGISEEGIIAYIVLEPGSSFSEREFRDRLKDTLEPHELPRKFIPVGSLPKSESGKLLRNEMTFNFELEHDSPDATNSG